MPARRRSPMPLGYPVDTVWLWPLIRVRREWPEILTLDQVAAAWRYPKVLEDEIWGKPFANESEEERERYYASWRMMTYQLFNAANAGDLRAVKLRLGGDCATLGVHAADFRPFLEQTHRWPLPPDCLLATWFRSSDPLIAAIQEIADERWKETQAVPSQPKWMIGKLTENGLSIDGDSVTFGDWTGAKGTLGNIIRKTLRDRGYRK
jgi:hypothetical protein